jgi:uncharacterized protein (TIGR00645 family)
MASRPRNAPRGKRDCAGVRRRRVRTPGARVRGGNDAGPINLLDCRVNETPNPQRLIAMSKLFLRPIPRLIFMTRWLQLPLYLGLIVAQAVYVWLFWVELTHLVEAAFGNQAAMQQILIATTPAGQVTATMKTPSETVIMLVVLGLIDVVMISNLLIMVIVGGYETFVSRMHLEDHPDQPEWLSHVNASVLKVKLATAIIGISSIHLLKTFINAAAYDEKTLLWQTLIHIAFLLSAMAIAAVDRILPASAKGHAKAGLPRPGPVSGH